MPDDELLKIRNFGEKSLTELREKLAERGITAPERDTPMAALGEGEAEGGADLAEEVSSLSVEDLGELIGSTGGQSPIADATYDDSDDSDDDTDEDNAEDDDGDDEEGN
jgi:hypothetical protein